MLSPSVVVVNLFYSQDPPLRPLPAALLSVELSLPPPLWPTCLSHANSATIIRHDRAYQLAAAGAYDTRLCRQPMQIRPPVRVHLRAIAADRTTTKYIPLSCIKPFAVGERIRGARRRPQVALLQLVYAPARSRLLFTSPPAPSHALPLRHGPGRGYKSEDSFLHIIHK